MDYASQLIPGKLYRPALRGIPLWECLLDKHFTCAKWIVCRDILFYTGRERKDNILNITFYEFLYGIEIYYLKSPIDAPLESL